MRQASVNQRKRPFCCVGRLDRVNAGNRPPPLGDEQATPSADALQMATQLGFQLANTNSVNGVNGAFTHS
jgi:hypothetical protein